ncbi:MAG: di-trans,poly-cis-decaprenylcistransferase [Acidimicrobiia bacterium]|nr:di-trans,poly-cis-decaprenylcistransferase [Acidimicrobiia bacterium]
MVEILNTEIDPDRVPRHVGVIMDGNGRWANARGLDRTAGHVQGEPALFDVIEGALELGIEWLTAYTFSTENWGRPQYEVEFLMNFNIDLLQRRTEQFKEMGIRIHYLGDRADDRIPGPLKDLIENSEQMTKHNTRMRLVFAFNYGGRAEIVRAAGRVAAAVLAGDLDVAAVDEDALRHHLGIADMPDPELIVRSSGEHRISNFLLWQSAYSEYVFEPTLWPDFDRYTLAACVAEYQGRKRRFGGVISDAEEPA